MAMNVAPFQSTDEFTMAGFNGKISDINSGVDNEITSALSGFARIETGSYVGTGEFGSGKKNTLTFSRKPLAVIIQATDARRFAVLLNGCTSGNAVSVGSGDRVNVSWTDTSVSWYNSEKSSIQMNDSGITYLYMAIG